MKKFFKVSGFILTVLLLVFSILCVKSYFESKKPVISKGYYKDFKSSAELELKYSVPGPYEISSYIFDIDDKSIDKIRVWYPSELENESKKYPMIMVVNASNVQAYLGDLSLLVMMMDKPEPVNLLHLHWIMC